MTTITRFTKEQLIAKLQHQLTVAAKYPDVEEAELDAAIFQIALASLTAEPVAWTDADELRDAKNRGNGYLFAIGGNANKFADPRRQMMLYAASPAPVVLPSFDEWLTSTGRKPVAWVREVMEESYNACRAALLQGSQPVSNRDELPATQQPQNAQQNIPNNIPSGLIEAVNDLLNNDGSRGRYSAIGCGNAREKIELWLSQRQKWES